MLKGVWGLVFLFVVLLSLNPEPTGAYDTRYFEGCMECRYVGITNQDQFCFQVGHERYGMTECKETDVWYTVCQTLGESCYNVDVWGGGGKTGGGGGSCTIGLYAVCPAECFSCNRLPY